MKIFDYKPTTVTLSSKLVWMEYSYSSEYDLPEALVYEWKILMKANLAYSGGLDDWKKSGVVCIEWAEIIQGGPVRMTTFIKLITLQNNKTEGTNTIQPMRDKYLKVKEMSTLSPWLDPSFQGRALRDAKVYFNFHLHK